MAKAKSKAKVAAAAPELPALKKGSRVKVMNGNFGNSVGIIESISGKNCTVFVHGRLTITVPADTLRAL